MRVFQGQQSPVSVTAAPAEAPFEFDAAAVSAAPTAPTELDEPHETVESDALAEAVPAAEPAEGAEPGARRSLAPPPASRLSPEAAPSAKGPAGLVRPAPDYSRRMPVLVLLLLVLWPSDPRTFGPVQATGAQKPFVSPYSAADVANKQAVVETTMGSFVIALYADKAPNHAGYFIKTARDGGYTGTTIHRVVKYGIIQGGDPLSKDPSKAALYGTGGMNALKGEINAEPMTAGAVAAALVPGRPDSGGAQFFVCATDQPTLQGQFTIFGRVVEGTRSRPEDFGRERRRAGPPGRAHRHQVRHDSRHAAAGETAVRR